MNYADEIKEIINAYKDRIYDEEFTLDSLLELYSVMKNDPSAHYVSADDYIIPSKDSFKITSINRN